MILMSLVDNSGFKQHTNIHNQHRLPTIAQR